MIVNDVLLRVYSDDRWQISIELGGLFVVNRKI